MTKKKAARSGLVVARPRDLLKKTAKSTPATPSKRPLLKDLSDDELAAISDDVEREARDRTVWQETAESKAARPERETWFDDNMTAISIRMPNGMLELLRAVAAVEGIGYQTLIKKWLHRDLTELARQRRETRDGLAKSLKGDVDERAALLSTLKVARR